MLGSEYSDTLDQSPLSMILGTSRIPASNPASTWTLDVFTPVPNPPAPTTPTPTTTTLQDSFEHILTFRTPQQGEHGEVSTWNLFFPPSGASDTPSASTPQGEVGTTHLALSLKEMREIPGGAFRAFWELEYKMSMPRMGIEKGMSEISQRNLPQ